MPQELRRRVVTIAIPTWNRLTLLRRAVGSALAQTYSDIQIVISDDGSSDGTRDYINGLSDPSITRLLKSTNGGLVANYNSCLNAATSEFFLLLNDDDSLLPEAIAKLVNAFLNPPNGIEPDRVGLSWCPHINVDAACNDLWPVRGGPPLETSVDLIEGLFNGTRGPICSGIMFRTADALAVGGYDPRFRFGCEDSDLWGKVALRRDFVVCAHQPLMRYLMHGSNGATASANCEAWQAAKRMEIEDFANVLRSRNDAVGEARLRRSFNHTLANVTLTVLLRIVGNPGWIRIWITEFWRSRRFMLTPFVFKRAFKDGWKLLRLRHTPN